MQAIVKSTIKSIFPPLCSVCGARVESDFALCPGCWREAAFATGLACCQCAQPLLGHSDRDEYCDDCLTEPRPWQKGRSAMLYEGTARRAVMALKHADRPQLARAMAAWMVPKVRDLVTPHTLIVPVPLHWTRIAKRRYNQSALIAKALARELDVEYCADLLRRPRRTKPLKGDVESRTRTMAGAICPHPRRSAKGRDVVIIDDVMTTGATLAAATCAAQQAGAERVDVAVLARVAKDV